MTDHRAADGLLTIEKVLALKKAGLFELVAEDDLVEIAYIATEEHVSAGEVIMREGELGSSMFAIVRGAVRVHSGEREFARLGPGEVVGELAALDPEPRSASVTATEDTLLLRIHGASLRDLMAEQPALSEGIIVALCRRLRSTDRTIALRPSTTMQKV